MVHSRTLGGDGTRPGGPSTPCAPRRGMAPRGRAHARKAGPSRPFSLRPLAPEPGADRERAQSYNALTRPQLVASAGTGIASTVRVTCHVETAIAKLVVISHLYRPATVIGSTGFTMLKPVSVRSSPADFTW